MLSKVLATSVALASLASAQTFTSCDPTKKTCPADKAIGAGTHSIDFRNGASDFFDVAEGTTLTYDKDNGAIFSIAADGQAPTITSKGTIFFGEVSVVVKASLGVGVVTSVTLQSDDLDEIDWEWLGGDATQVQTNYFSKGCTEVYDRGGYSPVSDPQHNFDTYTIKWDQNSVQWIINGNTVRTLKASEASGCDGFPQTPMYVKLGTWVAGKKDNPQGTIDWAGGVTDFSQGPFLGYYQSVTVKDYMGNQGATSASEYSYGDMTGTWQSIKITGGNSSSDDSSSSSSGSSSTKTSSGKASTTTLSTTTTGASNSTATHSPTASGTHSNSSTTVSTPTGGSSSTSSPTTTPNAAGKLAGSIALAGAGILAALLL